MGRTDAEAPILWLPDMKSWLTGKDPNAGKDWGQEENGASEDEMVGWHHRLNGHEFEQAPGVGDGQGSLACCSPWHRKESDTTERLNWIYHFVSLCHILVIFTIFLTFKKSLLYLLWWSVISNLWYYCCKKIVICWRLRWRLAFLAIKNFSIKIYAFLLKTCY